MRKFTVLAVAAAFVATGTTATLAKNAGNSANTPGHKMQEFGSVPGHPGASGYAPGHLKKKNVRTTRTFTTRSGRTVTTGSGVR